MMDLEDQGKDPNAAIESVDNASVPAPTATVTTRDILATKLKLSAKELKCLQEMLATNVGMEHLLQATAQEGIDMPATPNLCSSQEPFGEFAAVQLESLIKGLVLLTGDMTIDSDDKEDRKVNKECLRYDFSHGRCPLRPNSHDGSWSKETHVLSQARMAPKVHALQHGSHQAWLQALGLKKDMSLVSDNMSQQIQLDNGSTLPPYIWPSDNSFTDDDAFGYPTHDLSFVVKGLWEEFPYLRRMEDFPYPQKYKCKARTSEIKPKFAMYYGVPAHNKCGLPVSTFGIIQGGLHSEGVCTIYAQEVKDFDSNFCWTTTKTCTWCNKAFSNGESVMNHRHAHYWIVLVCLLCGKQGSHSYPSMRDHIKKCKDTYHNLLEGSDAETGLYKPCFCKGDTHLSKEGLAQPTAFTYKLEENCKNTKTVEQLTSEFLLKAQEEVTAIHQACALC